tara:strand:+ start:320 stop:1789 length:1470 start_codon:yes stop_codon:yes gene_type:complete
MVNCIPTVEGKELVTIRLDNLISLQREAKAEFGGCNTANYPDTPCFNPSMALSSTGVLSNAGEKNMPADPGQIPPATSGICKWDGEDARFLAPTPEILPMVTKNIGGKSTQVTASTPPDQLWQIRPHYFFENNVNEILYKISSNPSKPSIAQVAQGYGVTETDYKFSGMVTAGSYVIDVGLAPQKGSPPNPVVPEDSSEFLDSLIPVTVADFTKSNATNLFSKGSWKDGSSWLHIDTCKKTAGFYGSLIYLRLLNNDGKYFKLYLTIDPVAYDRITPMDNNGKITCVSQVQCDNTGGNCQFIKWVPVGNDYFPVTMPPLEHNSNTPNPAYTNQLKWLPWPDDEDIFTSLGGRSLDYLIMKTDRADVAGADRNYSVPYLTLMQWSIKIDQNGGGAPPPSGNMCTPDKGTKINCENSQQLETNCDAEFACEKCMPGENPYWVQYGGHCGSLGPDDKCQYAEKCFKDSASCLKYSNSGQKYFKTGDGVPTCS